MADDWMPVFVLPNISLEETIGCEIAALAPAHDSRVAALKRAHPVFRKFLKSFSDNFGQKFEPAVMLRRADAPKAFNHVDALASFRDLIALSAIIHSYVREIRHPTGGHRVFFGEAFALYPWMPDRNYGSLIGSTPAILGSHDVSSFKGQSSPTIFRTHLDATEIDRPLLSALMVRWRRRHDAAEPAWKDVATMRSLNMAYHASMLPAGSDTTFYDVGRIVSLWISAFEILVHPGGNGQANRDKVLELIERTAWAVEESGKLVHNTGSKKRPVKRTLASWLYQVLNERRNDFLHGNPVDRSKLRFPVSQKPISHYAAPLYRIALTAFLPLEYKKPVPSTDDPEACGTYIAGRMNFMDPQIDAERALLTAMQQIGTSPQV